MSNLSEEIRRALIPKAFQELFVPASYKGWYGGRGSAKSHSFAAAAIVKGMMKPLTILCCREIQLSIRDSVKRLLDLKIDQLGLRGIYLSTNNEIRGRNGTTITFKGLRTGPESVKSTEGIDIVWVEEAQTVSENSLTLLKPTIRKLGSELWFTWNPRFEKDPIDKMLRKEPPPGALIRRVSWEDNPWFHETRMPEELEYDKRRDPEKYAHIWLGEYQRTSEASVFRNWRVEAFETPDQVARFYFGADWGFSVDPTVLVRAYIVDKTLFIDAEAYAIGCTIENTPSLFAGSDVRPGPNGPLKERWSNPKNYPGIAGAARWPIVADSARPEMVDYMARRDFKIVSARKGAGSLEDGIEWLKNFDIVVHPRCQHAIDELTLYRYKVDKQDDTIVLPDLEDKHNHVIDALRYAVEARRRAPVMAMPLVFTQEKSYPGDIPSSF